MTQPSFKLPCNPPLPPRPDPRTNLSTYDQPSTLASRISPTYWVPSAWARGYS